MHSPRKQNYFRRDDISLKVKALYQEIMSRTQIGSNFLKNNIDNKKGKIQNKTIILSHF